MEQKFKDKVVIVTGASSGIGAATAVAFAKEGAKLVITGRNKERLAETAKQCNEIGALETLEIIADLQIFETLEQLINKTVEKFGAIDILVNNAGFGIKSSIEELELSKYEDIFNANVRAPIFLSKYALPHLKKTKGCIVNVSSIAALRGYPGSLPYGITKCALDHFTRGFSAECVSFGVRVNSINPGVVESRFNDNLGMEKEALEAYTKYCESFQPLGGIIPPSAVVEGILYLTSASHVTGSCLLVDGGGLLEK